MRSEENLGVAESTEKIERLVAPTLQSMGFDLVRVSVSGGRHPTLQVMAERLDGMAMTVEDCAAISRALSAGLDGEDPLAGPHTLEVSSPGIDRPLVRAQDFARFSGFFARIETVEPVDGRRRFSGRLLGIADGLVRMRQDDRDVELNFADIKRAKLMLTDDLIAAAEKGRRPG